MRISDAFKSLDTQFLIELHQDCKRLQANDPKLTILIVWDCQIKRLDLVAEALRENRVLKELFINKGVESLGERGGVSLSLILQNPNTALKKLQIENNIGTMGIRALARGLESNRSLRSFVLTDRTLEIEGVRAIIRALRANHSVTEVVLLARDYAPPHFYFTREQKGDEEELQALLTRNRNEALQQLRMLEVEANTLRRSVLDVEAVRVYERIIQFDRDLPCEWDSARSDERKRIRANAETSRIFCIERFAPVAPPAPPPAAAPRPAEEAPPRAVPPPVEARAAGATPNIGMFGGRGSDASSGNNRNNTAVTCHCGCAVM